jgi:chromate reductase, NAD(P)H dehydrogenase (quinone)
MAKDHFTLLGLSGSLRAASSSTAILRTLTQSLPPDISMNISGIADLPLYNEDLDRPTSLPASVAALRTAIDQADGIVLATPEYNHSIPGVLKNALDWASRPSHYSCMVNKPFLVITVAGSQVGGARAQSHIHTILLASLARIPPGREIVIGGVTKKITNGVLTDAPTLQFILNAIDGLLHEACIVNGHPIRPASRDGERRMNLAGRA